MNANEIKRVVELYNAIFSTLEECRRENEKNPDDDLLWCQCKRVDEYAGNRIISNRKLFICQEFDSQEQTAAHYAAICLNAGATAKDIYVDY